MVDQKFLAAGAYLYGALSLIGLFVMGLVLRDNAVMLLAILSAGAAYGCQVIAALAPTEGASGKAAFGLMGVSCLSGLAAFVLLLMRV